MKTKYVILDDCNPVLISEANKHSDVRAMGRPTSAGFFSVQEVEAPKTAIQTRHMKVECWGESQSLGLKSQPNDAWLIERYIFGNE